MLHRYYSLVGVTISIVFTHKSTGSTFAKLAPAIVLFRTHLTDRSFIEIDICFLISTIERKFSKTIILER